MLELQEAERYRLGREDWVRCRLESVAKEHCSLLEERVDSSSRQ